jgi:hypothetical protein
MIEVLPESKGHVVAIRMAETVTNGDIDGCMERIEGLIADEHTNRLLLDWSGLNGWESGARSLGTWFAMHHWATIHRVAIVADARWEDEALRITDIFKAAQVRRYAPAERDDALRWLGA